MCFWDDVVGGQSRRCHGRRNNDVAGAEDNRLTFRVNATIDEREFCRAVRRCLEDLIAGAEDENGNGRHHKCRRRS